MDAPTPTASFTTVADSLADVGAVNRVASATTCMSSPIGAVFASPRGNTTQRNPARWIASTTSPRAVDDSPDGMLTLRRSCSVELANGVTAQLAVDQLVLVTVASGEIEVKEPLGIGSQH